ncbi:MAG: transketolase C-terminal domain-containing protein [Halobacteriota archaeon]|nr:transketolase C-terminal domain-containing protein [Halobacteriota archaeon]
MDDIDEICVKTIRLLAVDGVEKAIENAQEENTRPSLIIVRTHIDFGSPKQDNASAHGEPLGPEAVKETKKRLNWPIRPDFYIPEEALNHFRQSLARGSRREEEWEYLVKSFKSDYPDIGHEFDRVIKGELPPDLKEAIPIFKSEEGAMATRSASGKVMNAIAIKLPHMLTGGSGDLAPSTKTILIGYGDFGFSDACEHNLHFGVREHAMGAIVNGMALHGGTIPHCATFLVFSDYMRPALRLSALMNVKSIFVFTHDSIGLGEDGPTHQPVEQIMSLRAIPGMTIIRPADANETAFAWKVAVERDGPVALALTRQNLPVLNADIYPISDGLCRGAYILKGSKKEKPDLIIIATGSEVHLALKARVALKDQNVHARVVSMPCWEIFEEQSEGYKRSVLIPGIPRLSIEAGITLGWCKHIGQNGEAIGLDRFGASAPGKVVLDNLGFNVENIVSRALKLIGR